MADEQEATSLLPLSVGSFLLQIKWSPSKEFKMILTVHLCMLRLQCTSKCYIYSALVSITLTVYLSVTLTVHLSVNLQCTLPVTLSILHVTLTVHFFMLHLQCTSASYTYSARLHVKVRSVFHQSCVYAQYFQDSISYIVEL